ncbi:MAG: hypothetical protein K1X66_03210 [Verrucomicrobiae bacterium]|nr:hypothetical protein [Verrucomicrobiae bacterium]
MKLTLRFCFVSCWILINSFAFTTVSYGALEHIIFFRAKVTQVGTEIDRTKNANGTFAIGDEFQGQFYFADCAVDTNPFPGIGDYLNAPLRCALDLWDPTMSFYKSYHYPVSTGIIQEGNGILIKSAEEGFKHTYSVNIYALEYPYGTVNGYFPIKFNFLLYTEIVNQFWPNGDGLLLVDDFNNLNLNDFIKKEVTLTFEKNGQSQTVKATLTVLIGKGVQFFPDQECQ